MPYREFEDDEGRQWRAWETRPRAGANVRPGLVDGWLSFEGEGGKRRLTPVPRGWGEAGDEELRALLASARKVAEHDPDAPHGHDHPDGSPEAALSGRTGTVIRRAREVLRSIEETLRRTGGSPPSD